MNAWLDVGVIAVATAALTAVLGFWDRVDAGWKKVRGLVVASRAVNQELAKILLGYLNATNPRPTASQTYGVMSVLVRPLAATARVAYRVLWSGEHRFRYRGRGVWYDFDPMDDANRDIAKHVDNYGERAATQFNHTFEFWRGRFEWEQLIADALSWAQAAKTGVRRFQVVQVQPDPHSSGDIDISVSSASDHAISPDSANVPLSWEYDDLGYPPDPVTLATLSLSQDVLDAAHEVKTWFSSRSWFEDRGIPWCRKYGLEGAPGTGKTSFARAVANDLDIPIYVLDLSSMENAQLTRAWNLASDNAPCLILVEDVDSIFGPDEKGTMRQARGRCKLTFDALLNTIDGAQRNKGGILVMLSTNHIDALDPALRRAGRMDRVVHFREMSPDGRMKLALRIIGDAALAQQLVDASDGTSPAEFQEILFPPRAGGFVPGVKP